MTKGIKNVFNQFFSGRSDKNSLERDFNIEKPEVRNRVIERAVKKTVEDYGEALKKLGSE